MIIIENVLFDLAFLQVQFKRKRNIFHFEKIICYYIEIKRKIVICRKNTAIIKLPLMSKSYILEMNE